MADWSAATPCVRSQRAQGGDWLKESTADLSARACARELGEALAWHGGLSLDDLMADGAPSFIDANPRLAEPGNALAAGLNLPDLLARVSVGAQVEAQPAAPAGARTRLGLQGLMQAAAKRGRRVDVLRALGPAWLAPEPTEELLPWREDPRAGLALW